MSQINRELHMTIQASLREAVARRHAYLTVEHLLYALAHDDAGANVLRQVGADLEQVRQALDAYFEDELEKLPDGERGETAQTLAFHRVLQSALQHAESAEKEEVEAGDLLAAILNEPDSFAVDLLRRQDVSRLDVLRYVSHGESKLKPPKPKKAGGDGAKRPKQDARGGGGGDEDEMPADPLAAFAQNLTELAAQGKLDPLVGREGELDRAVHILARRRKNNPIFVGETGVGKTAIAEGLAQRIHEGKVPATLQSAEIHSLDLGALLAGTKYRGDFEQRFKALIAALQERENPVLFIDEIHTILGAGAASGATVDASNLLKPLLQSGELRFMGSTTHQEYRHFEKDRALARRFQRIDVPEPSEAEAQKILEGLAPRYEAHHGVKYSKPALAACVELSAQHINDRFLPDKAIDVMDEAGSRARITSLNRPPEIEAMTKDIEAVCAKKEQAIAAQHFEEAAKHRDSEKQLRAKQDELVETWKKTRDVNRATIDEELMAQVVADWTGIPLSRLERKESEKLLGLEAELQKTIIGQDAATVAIAKALRRSRADLKDPRRPIGSFMFLGPTGVGKTELAKQLARALGVEFIRFDMSEYMERHTVSRLIGAPPGYVGFDQGGLLTEAINKHPHAVLLLDEIEKAHPDVFNLLLQVMDHGALTDNNGRKADFRNVIIIMTTNAGAETMNKSTIGFTSKREQGDEMADIKRLFSPEFRNRLDAVIQFGALDFEHILRVVDKFLIELETQLQERHVSLSVTPDARRWLAETGFDPTMGARPMARVIQDHIKRALADELLFGKLVDGGRVVVSLFDGGLRVVAESENVAEAEAG